MALFLVISSSKQSKKSNVLGDAVISETDAAAAAAAATTILFRGVLTPEHMLHSCTIAYRFSSGGGGHIQSHSTGS